MLIHCSEMLKRATQTFVKIDLISIIYMENIVNLVFILNC